MPRDDPAVFVNGAVFPDVRSVAIDGFDTVSVKVEDCSVEVAGFCASSGWASVGATASYQCCGIEVPDRGRAGSGEGNVCGTSFYATPGVSCGVWEDELRGLPRRLLAEKEVSIVNPEADLVARLPNVAVAQRLEGG